jgi:hypothetical protein
MVTDEDKNNLWEIQAGNSGYQNADLNLDGEVGNSDKNIYWLPNLGKVSSIPQ